MREIKDSRGQELVVVDGPTLEAELERVAKPKEKTVLHIAYMSYN